MNSRRYTVASIAIAFMAVTLLSVPGFGGSAYAAGSGMSISADANYASGKISVNGDTDRSDDVIIKVTKSNGNIVSVAQVTPSGDSYMATISVGGALWSQDGMYTISAQQGDAALYKTSTQVDIKDGHVVPEFGTIAIMILVVAIVSIIALSAKTKLGLVPRY